eukprot:CAMPEP_0175478498 /NCGR_PEP_ID=MMETSP0095-20121207/76962_1 /TAXON_ID=311494 /ORGANISM="Alexandrium monilatum, Strain CCMP3105" /LENGTH=399 /DNA_ID=CAMNT_0016780095 /DNA_START=1 /DNA_END=1202 /DNA_ORIENTATION=-
MSAAPKWEVAWHPVKRRWYFEDRTSGRSAWSRPEGVAVTLPTKPPHDSSFEVPPPPENIPEGWSVAFCWQHKRYFYYNIKYQKPEHDGVASHGAASHEAASQAPSGHSPEAAEQARHKKEAGEKEDFFAMRLWDADSCKHRVMEAYAGKDHDILREIFTEVVDSNRQLLSGRRLIRTPETTKVSWAECIRALQEQKIEDYGADPKVTVGVGTVAEAVYFFVEGGGSPLPLWSLHVLRDEDPAQYADVLFTHRAELSRGHEDEGFPIFPHDKRVTVSILSAAPPDVRNQELATSELLTSATMSLFVAPVYKEPRCTTLVLGPWGCNVGVPNNEILTHLVRGILGELPGMSMKLGRLYHEIHFAIPKPQPCEDKKKEQAASELMEVFTCVLAQERLDFTEI